SVLPDTSEPTMISTQPPVPPALPDATWRIAEKQVVPQEQPDKWHAPIGMVKPKKGWRPNKWQIAVAAVLLLLLLAWGINTLHTTLPATNATVTSQPMSKQINKTYTITVSAQDSTGPLTVKGRALSSSSRQLVQTVPATGRGHHDAVSAHGVMVVSQINLTSSTGNDMLNLSIGDNNGVTATGDDPAHIYNGGVVSIPSHATPAGSV